MSIRVLLHEQWYCEKGSYADNYFIKGTVIFFISNILWELRYSLVKTTGESNLLDCHPKKLGYIKVECPYQIGFPWRINTISKQEVEDVINHKLLGVLIACTDGG